MKVSACLTTASLGIAYGVAGMAALFGQDAPRPVATHQHFNSVEPSLIENGATTGASVYKNPTGARLGPRPW